MDSCPFDNSHVNSLSQRSQSDAEIEADLNHFSAVLAISASGNLFLFRPKAALRRPLENYALSENPVIVLSSLFP